MADIAMPQGLTPSESYVRKNDEKLLSRGQSALFGLFDRKFDDFLQAQERAERRQEMEFKRSKEQIVEWSEKANRSTINAYSKLTSEQRKLEDRLAKASLKSEKENPTFSKFGSEIEAARDSALRSVLGPLAEIVDPMRTILGGSKERKARKNEKNQAKLEAIRKMREKTIEDHASERTKERFADSDEEHLERLEAERKGLEYDSQKAFPSQKKSKKKKDKTDYFEEGPEDFASYASRMYGGGEDLYPSAFGGLPATVSVPGLGGRPQPPESLDKVGIFGSGLNFSGTPNEDNIKKFDPGSVYLAEVFRGAKAEEQKEKKTGVLGNLLDGLEKGLGEAFTSGLGNIKKIIQSKVAQRLAGGALILGGLMDAVFDGIQGMKDAKDWGVSDVSGFIGAFLAGKADGWKGMVGNTLKWGAVGAGTGLMFGPMGMLIGGLLGAAIGALLNFVGGKEISKMFDGLLVSFGLQKIALDTPEEKKAFTEKAQLERQKNARDALDPETMKALRQNSAMFSGTDKGSVDARKKALGNISEKLRLQHQQRLNSSLLLPSKDFFTQEYQGDDLQAAARNIAKDPLLAESLGISKEIVSKGEAAIKAYLVEDSGWRKDHPGQGTDALAKLLYSKALGYDSLFNSLGGASSMDAAKSILPQLDATALTTPMRLNDGIITKSGQVIQTSPDDNIYAFKNLPDLGGAANGKANQSFSEINRSLTPVEFVDTLAEKIAEVITKLSKNGANVTQVNNMTDRFSQKNLLDGLTLEVS